MTRFLSEALEAKEPWFSKGLRQLELANGQPAADIRFSAEVVASSRRKIAELGLDPRDTLAPELYAALKEKLKTDDKTLTRRLRTLAASHVNAEAEPTAGMIIAIK